MERIARFAKVSREQFVKDWLDAFPGCNEASAGELYNSIKLPARATAGSAGYDFFLPSFLELSSGETVLIPTGIRAKIDNGWVLMMFPRSSLGFKYRMQLDNTVGIIDSDYYGADNEGHIKIKLTCDKKEDIRVCLEAGTGFAQGIFVPFGITEDDDVTGERRGGFGSTDKK